MSLRIEVEEICEDFAKSYDMDECFELTPEDLSDFFSNNPYDRLTVENLTEIGQDIATLSMVIFRDKIRDSESLTRSLLDKFLDV